MIHPFDEKLLSLTAPNEIKFVKNDSLSFHVIQIMPTSLKGSLNGMKPLVHLVDIVTVVPTNEIIPILNGKQINFEIFRSRIEYIR